MKIMPLFFFIFAIQITMMIFVTSSLTNDGSGGVINDSNYSFWNPLGNYSNYSSTDMDVLYQDTQGNNLTARSAHFWDVIFNPDKGNNNLMIQYIIGFAVMIGGLAFFPFINRSDLSMLASPFLFMLLAPTPVFINLYNFINNQMSGFVCNYNSLLLSVPKSCFVSEFFGVIIVGPLFLAWILACWENWTGRPVS